MFKVTLLTRTSELFDGEAKKAVLPGEDGQITILPFHSPLVLRLTRGEIQIDDQEFQINDGIARFEDNELHAVIE